MGSTQTQCKNPNILQGSWQPCHQQENANHQTLDTGEEDTSSKRMHIKDEAEYSPSDSDYDDVDVDKGKLESYNNDEDQLKRQGHRFSNRPPKQTDYQGDCKYQSVDCNKAKKQLIDRYVEVSGGIKADISPYPLPLPQEMSKQRNNYESRFTGHYPSPLQGVESYTDENGYGTCFTTCMYEKGLTICHTGQIV